VIKPITHEDELSSIQFQQKVEKSLAAKLGIPSLRAGNITIRDERDWRINERLIEYCWLINIARSFVGWCWLFTIKFNETKFRDKNNPAELIQGVFTINKDGAIDQYYKENRDLNYRDKIKELTAYDLFDVNNGITLDGIKYKYLVFALNAEVRIELNNPNSGNWKRWEEVVWELGVELTKKSASKYMQEIFTLK
jgi:hypothetical protein